MRQDQKTARDREREHSKTLEDNKKKMLKSRAYSPSHFYEMNALQ